VSFVAEDRTTRNAAEDKAPLPGGRWVNVVTHLDASYGGLSAVVPRLASTIACSTNFAIDLAAFCVPGEKYSAADFPALSITAWPASRMAWLKQGRLKADFCERLKDVDGIHIHGLWEQSTNAAASAARALRKPYIVSAHGMLESWALKNKRLKKTIYAALAERANVRGAACLHALTRAEAGDYRRFGATGPIAVVPNGVAIPRTLDAEPFLSAFPALRGKQLVLFLGRIHFKKGLDILVEAWGSVAKRWPEAQLVLAGPDFEGTQASVEAMVAERGLKERVLFTGMLRDELKWSALAAAQCFILPSYSEGLSVSTLEAMGVGLPVIVTEQCNLPEVAHFDTGWVIQSQASAVSAALNECLQNSQAANDAIGERGRKLIEERYNWAAVGRQMSEVYRWVQGGAFPTEVEILRGHAV
jgi:glycosyltransferase involved in cell wall biosynthesis